MELLDQARIEEVLSALGEQLAAADERFTFVVVGGSALLVLGLGLRTTRDVDVVALIRDGRMVRPTPFPEPLRRARARVARDYDLPENWLNAAPSSLLDFGLPEGFMSRLECRDYVL